MSRTRESHGQTGWAIRAHKALVIHVRRMEEKEHTHKPGERAGLEALPRHPQSEQNAMDNAARGDQYSQLRPS